MRYRLSIIAVILLSFPCALYASEDSADTNDSSFNRAFDSVSELVRELAAKAGLTEENQQTLDGILSSIKNTLNDPDPASKVQVEGKTKKQWDELNRSSPELDEYNRQLQEENQKRIDTM